MEKVSQLLLVVVLFFILFSTFFLKFYFMGILFFIFYLNSENVVAWKLSTMLGKQLKCMGMG